MPNSDPAAPVTPYRIALGFDFGRARIGVAIGEMALGTVRPLQTLPVRQQRPDWDAISRLIAEWKPEVLVVGVPRHADDTANTVTAAAQRFSRQLRSRFHLPVATIDERLSSWEAQQRYFETATLRRRATPTLDAEAAAIILESWFNQQRKPIACVTPNS